MRMKTEAATNEIYSPPAKKPKSKTYIFSIIIGIVLLNSIGLSIVLPLLPFVVGNYLPEHQVAVGTGALMSVYAVCTFFSAPVFGVLSDRFGRKNILIISLFGSVAGYILFGIGGALWILFLGRIIDGLTAGNISTLFAYVSDTTEPGERTKWFGYIGSAMGIGKLGGPALGGLLGSINPALPFFVTAALIFLSGLAVYFLLPESLVREKRTRHLTLGGFNTFLHFKGIFSLKSVKPLLITGLLFYVSLSIFQFNFIIFLKDNFKWGPAIVGAILTIVGVCEIISRALLLPWLLKRFPRKTVGAAGLVIFGCGLGFIVLSVFIHSVFVIALAAIFIISGEGLFDPVFNGMLSQSVEESQQGKLQGVNQSLQSLNNIFIPLLAAAIYFLSPVVLYSVASLITVSAILKYGRLPFPSDSVDGSIQ